MIELGHLDVRHFEIEECRHLSNGCTAKCGCIGFYIISLSIIIMSGRNKYYRICLGIGPNEESVTLWLQVVKTFTSRPHCP